MALVKCHECSKEISDQAAACPHCGAPVKVGTGAVQHPPNHRDKASAGAVILAIVIGIGWYLSSSSKNEPAPATQKPVACAKDDLQCVGDKGVVAAGVYCKDPIERLASHDVKWIDGAFELKFSRFRWLDQSAGSVTYLGDKAEFQNGFGAFTRVIYECDMGPDGKTVTDVRVREGRLPG